MKLCRAAKLGLAGLSLVLLLCIGLLLFANSASKKSAARVDPTVCEYCRGPLNKQGDCSRCMVEMGPTKYRARRESKNWYNSPLIASLLIGLLCILASIHIGYLLYQFTRRKKGVVVYHVRCTKCGRKLRYRDSQIEHMGRCPICQKPICFPKPIQTPNSSKWQKLSGLSWRRIRKIVWD